MKYTTKDGLIELRGEFYEKFFPEKRGCYAVSVFNQFMANEIWDWFESKLQAKEKSEKPREWEEYYFVDTDAICDDGESSVLYVKTKWRGDGGDKGRLNSGNCFWGEGAEERAKAKLEEIKEVLKK